RRRGITAASGASVKEITDGDDTVQVIYEVDGTSHGVTAEVCLVAVGRGPVTDDLGLDAAGGSIDERGLGPGGDPLPPPAHGPPPTGSGRAGTSRRPRSSSRTSPSRRGSPSPSGSPAPTSHRSTT